jgi:hypothetical protein
VFLFKLIGSPNQVEAITANFESGAPVFGMWAKFSMQ